MSESAHIKYNEFTGLIPGMMQDIEDINTAKLFRGFMEEEHPKCMSLTLPVIDGDNKETVQTHYISEANIRDRKSVVKGKSVDPGGRRIIKKKKEKLNAIGVVSRETGLIKVVGEDKYDVAIHLES